MGEEASVVLRRTGIIVGMNAQFTILTVGSSLTATPRTPGRLLLVKMRLLQVDAGVLALEGFSENFSHR
jgi:hypothetical protein